MYAPPIVNILNNYFHTVSFAGDLRRAHVTNHSGTFECENNRLLTEICFKAWMESGREFFNFSCSTQTMVYTHSVLMWTSGGFAVAFCITKNNFVTISITWPVWKTKSPFLRPISDWKNKQLLAGVRSICGIKVSEEVAFLCRRNTIFAQWNY